MPSDASKIYRPSRARDATTTRREPSSAVTHPIVVPHTALSLAPELIGGGNQAAQRWLRGAGAGARSSPAHAWPTSARPLTSALAARIDAARSGGDPLPGATREAWGAELGEDFGDVRVHRGDAAQDAARSLGARAFAVGRDVFVRDDLGDLTAPAAQGVLGHELAHVAQQRALSQPVVQRLVAPEDVNVEMIGATFLIAEPGTIDGVPFTGGEPVTIVDWFNTAQEVTVKVQAPHASAGAEIMVAKTKIRPAPSKVPGVVPFTTGVGGQASVVERGEAELTAEFARPAGVRLDEITRIGDLQATRWELLNRKLIQETMFNKLDASIRLWTDYYNALFGYVAKKDPLDPNLVKSMIYQESRMGTSGEHLELSPTWNVRSRFNVGQTIDSAASVLLLMMREIDPTLITKHKLDDIDKDLGKAFKDLEELPKKASRTPPEDARLAELLTLQSMGAAQNMAFGQLFLWAYKAPGHATGFEDAVNEMFANVPPGAATLDQSYDFWVRAAVRWLFDKRKDVSSWREAIRAYNGSGQKAIDYRNAVTGRAAAMKKAGAAGKPFKPEDIR